MTEKNYWLQWRIKKIDESKKNQTMQVLLDFKYQGDVYLFLDNQKLGWNSNGTIQKFTSQYGFRIGNVWVLKKKEWKDV